MIQILHSFCGIHVFTNSINIYMRVFLIRVVVGAALDTLLQRKIWSVLREARRKAVKMRIKQSEREHMRMSYQIELNAPLLPHDQSRKR